MLRRRGTFMRARKQLPETSVRQVAPPKGFDVLRSGIRKGVRSKVKRLESDCRAAFYMGGLLPWQFTILATLQVLVKSPSVVSDNPIMFP